MITGPSMLLWQKIEQRLIEMGERKRRLFIKKSQIGETKKSGDTQSEHLEKMFKQQEKQKSDIVKDFSSTELELMLMQSNKNNPIEVVTLLLSLSHPSSAQGGILSASQVYTTSYSNNSTTGGVLSNLESEHSRISKGGSNLLRLKNQNPNFNNPQKGASATDGQTEKLFDQYYTTPKERQFQQNILTRLKTSDEHLQQHQIKNLNIPQSSQSAKKESYSNQNTFKDNSQGLKNYLSQGEVQGGNTNSQYIHQSSTIGSNTNLNSDSQNRIPNPIKKSKSKSKNKTTFDRSDIALQTGLALTHQHHKITLNDISKKIVLPSIVNNPATTTSAMHQNQHILSNHAAVSLSKDQYSSQGAPSIVSHKGSSSVASYIQQSSFLQQQQNQTYVTSIGGGSTTVTNGAKSDSKYRVNKNNPTKPQPNLANSIMGQQLVGDVTKNGSSSINLNSLLKGIQPS